MVTETTGLPDGAVPLVLGVYGIGSLLGITVGGRTADLCSTGKTMCVLGASSTR